MPTKTILFVHGNFVNHHCWDNWVSRFEAKGYQCLAVPYPGRDKPVKALRQAHPDPKLGELTITQVIEGYEQAIKTLSEPPIIIGHSFGGLLTQILINRGWGVAGVAIDSVPAPGVLTTKWSFIKSLWPVLNPLIPASRPYLMSLKHFQYTFVNGMTLEEQKQAYDESVTPESRRVCRGGLGRNAKVDFDKEHAPLLFIAGETDHIMPASLNKSNYKRYKAPGSVTDFKEFAGRNHFIIGAKGWEEVADFALDWAVNQSNKRLAKSLV